MPGALQINSGVAVRHDLGGLNPRSKKFHFPGSFVIASFTACLLASEPVKSWSGNFRYFTISSKLSNLFDLFGTSQNGFVGTGKDQPDQPDKE